MHSLTDQCLHGFRNKLPTHDQYNQYETLVAATTYDKTYLFLDLNFTCDGILKKVMMPWYIRGRQFENGYKLLWEKTLLASLSLWKRIDGKIIQIGAWAFTATLDNFRENQKPMPLTMDQKGTINLTLGINVTKNDFIGVTLPQLTQKQNKIVSKHLPILVQQRIPEETCMSGNYTTLTSSCYMPQRPNALLQIEFQPESTGSTSKSEILVIFLLLNTYYVQYIIHTLIVYIKTFK